MDVIYPVIWKCIHRDKVKLRGSKRTKRLRKKRYKHWGELYEKYRDEIFMKSHGLTFMQWRAKMLKDRDDRFMAKYGMTYRERLKSKRG